MRLKSKKDKNNGFLSEFKELDSIVQGFQKSDLIIIAGRPSMGKTAFSLNIAKNIVQNYKVPLLIFTLEMSRQQIIYRLLSSEAQINGSRLKAGRMTSLEWDNLTKAMRKIAKMPIYIDDNPNLTLNDIKSKLRKTFVEKNKTGIIIIDYLQLMKSSSKLENRVQEISYLTRNLKLIAKEFNLPILLLSQLSRNVESRVNKRPMLSDLRDSGCLVKNTEKMHDNLYSWNQENILYKNSINFQFKGIKPTYLITFQNNIKIQLTSNHKILSKNGWVRSSELYPLLQVYCLINNSEKQGPLNYNYHTIQKIEYQGINAVYDKTIPFFHNYIVDNYILHNSIEQDADIVIMLYREDYYDEKTVKNQLTEFIVAKHRNGPVGTARLMFDSSLTTFKNVEI